MLVTPHNRKKRANKKEIKLNMIMKRSMDYAELTGKLQHSLLQYKEHFAFGEGGALLFIAFHLLYMQTTSLVRTPRLNLG